MLNLPAERGWVSENLPFGPRLRHGPQGRVSLTHPRSAGRFIPDLSPDSRKVAYMGSEIKNGLHNLHNCCVLGACMKRAWDLYVIFTDHV